MKYISVCCNCDGEAHFKSFMTCKDACIFCGKHSWVIHKMVGGVKKVAGAFLVSN